jgi:hypothetical protein
MVSACTSMRIRQGELCDRAYLEELQRRASLANPGDTPHLLEQPEVIALPEWQLSSGRVLVAESASVMLGFAVLLAPLEGSAELTGVFVEPGCCARASACASCRPACRGLGPRLRGAFR